LAVIVFHYVIRVGVCTHQPEYFGRYSGFFAHLTHRGLGDGLADVMPSAWQGPEGIISLPYKQHVPDVVPYDNGHGRNDTVRGGGVRIVHVVDSGHGAAPTRARALPQPRHVRTNA